MMIKEWNDYGGNLEIYLLNSNTPLLTDAQLVMSQGVHMFPWKVLGPGDDNSESINTSKVYCP